MNISSQVKSALRKLREDKDYGCDSSCQMYLALYKSCVARLAKWTTLFADLNTLTRFLRFQTTEWENDETCE